MVPGPGDPETSVAFALAVVVLLLAVIRLRPRWVVTRPRAVLLAIAAVSTAALAALLELDPPGLRVVLDASEEPLMVRGDPARDVYDHAVRTFGGDDTYVVAMQTEDVFTPDHLAALRRVAEEVLGLPGVRRAESLADIHAYRYDAAEDRLEITRLVRDIPTQPQELADLRRRALTDPIYPKLVVSKDGRTAAINIYLRRMSDRQFVEQRLDERIRAIAAQEAAPERRFWFTGRPHIKSRTHRVMVADLVRLIPLSVVVAAVVVFALTASPRGVLLPLGACLTAVLWTFGLLAALDVPLNLITLVLGPTLIALGGLYGVHVIGRYDVEFVSAAGPREAALGTLDYCWLPVVLAGFTTCVGFGALMLADVQATRELGLFALFGVACLTLVSISGVPAALALLPLPASAARPPARAAIEHLLEAAAKLAARRPGRVLAAWALLAGGAALALPRIVIDTDYLTYFDRSSPVRVHFTAVDRLLIGPVPLYVTFSGEKEAAFRDPEALRALERIQRRIDALPGVSGSLSMVDILRKLNRYMERDDPAEERIPDSAGAVSDLVFLVPKDQMRRFASSNHGAANILVRTGRQGSRAIRELEARIREVLAGEDALSGLEAQVTGNAVVLNRSADHVAGDQLMSVGFAAITILVLISGVFRSLRVGLLAMVPNGVPVLVFFGLLGAGVAPLSLPTGLIGCVALGVAIDDTMHLLVSYRRSRQDGDPPERAVAVTLHRVGRPVLVTSIMLVAGFLTVTLSGFATIRQFGALTALTMAICLATDLLLLPALLVRTRA
ncbi:MAG: MMPL family transporter [Myxococcota bacterium]|nr:MMPL family transporter [Myxococcota bacterium]